MTSLKKKFRKTNNRWKQNASHFSLIVSKNAHATPIALKKSNAANPAAWIIAIYVIPIVFRNLNHAAVIVLMDLNAVHVTQVVVVMLILDVVIPINLKHDVTQVVLKKNICCIEIECNCN